MAATNLSISVTLADKVSQPARQVNAAIDGMNKRMKSATLGTNGFGDAVGKSTRMTKKFAMSGLQQAGYQVGDFAVQVGAGTSAVQAFGQQGSQLLGIFGPVGAILGAGVAIAAAIGTAYEKSAKQTNDFSIAADNLNDSFSGTTTKMGNAFEAAKTIKDEYGKVTEATIKAAKAQLIYDTVLQQSQLVAATTAIKNFATEIDGAEQASRMLGRTINNPLAAAAAFFENKIISLTKTTLSDLAEDLGTKVTGGVVKLRDALQSVAASTGEEQIKAAASALQVMAANGLMATEKGQDLAKALQAIIAANSKLETVDLKELLENIDNARDAVSGAAVDFDKLSQSVAQSFGDSFKSIITGTESVKDAFKNMARNIIDQLIEVLIIQRLVGTVGGNGKAGTGLAGLLSGTRAVGGPITTGQSYLVGEKGPEIITAGANARVIPNHQIGGGTTVVQNINISTGVSQTVRAEITQMLPQIQDAAKAAVIDARRRGGNFAGAFGG